MVRYASAIVVLMAAIGAVAASAQADVFVLRSGGRVEGELLNPEESPRRQYEVQLREGGKATFAADQVQEHVAVRPDEAEYAEVRRGFPDTIDGQWALAEWCREHKLFDERDTHLERVIELDSDHARARAALGYSKVEGRWAKQDEVMEARGMVRYKGRYRTQQEIELMEAARKQELAEKDWFQKINRWRDWLSTDKAVAARTSLLTIEDPAAVKALVHGLRNDPVPAARTLFAEALSRFDSPAAVKALATAAIEDAHEEVRLTCLDYLQKKPSPDAVAYFCTQLKSKDNVMVNRAGVALGKLRDPSSIAPLIDALVTTHTYKITTSRGTHNVGFGSSGPSGFSFGNSNQIIKQDRTNQAVLDSLVAMTRQNFYFNEAEWRKWYAMQKQRETIDARRD